MAKSASTKASDPSELFLIKLNNISWNNSILIPASLLTQFTQLMSLLTVVQCDDNLRQCSAKVYFPEPTQQGELDYGITRFGTSMLVSSEAEAKEFIAFHNSTVELQSISDYAAVPHVTLDEFHQHAQEEQTK